MKKFIILLIAITATVFVTSCDSDDDNVAPASLEGTWKTTAETEGGVAVSLTACELEETATFTSATATFYDYDDNSNPCTYETNTYPYTRTGDNITITVTQGQTTFTVTAAVEVLNATTLRVRTISDSQGGVYTGSDAESTTYARQ
jgi:hypothetical protein